MDLKKQNIIDNYLKYAEELSNCDNILVDVGYLPDKLEEHASQCVNHTTLF